MRLRPLSIVASIVLLAAGLAVAGSGSDGRRTARMGMRLDRMTRQLDLTEGQQTRIREIYQQHRDDGLGDAARKSRSARFDLRNIVRDPAASEKAIRDAAARVTQADADLAVERHKTLVEVFGVLTPEQQQKAKTLRDQRAARRPTI